MTPKESYDIIYRATGAVPLDRANHQVLEQALAVFAQIVAPVVMTEKPKGDS
jgi:hypothetical protein